MDKSALMDLGSPIAALAKDSIHTHLPFNEAHEFEIKEFEAWSIADPNASLFTHNLAIRMVSHDCPNP